MIPSEERLDVLKVAVRGPKLQTLGHKPVDSEVDQSRIDTRVAHGEVEKECEDNLGKSNDC